MSFRERLRESIEKKGVTSYKIAKDTSLSRASIDRYISGNSSPDIDKVNIIASYLGVSIDWLVSGNGEMFLNKDIQHVDTGDVFIRLHDFIESLQITHQEFEDAIGDSSLGFTYGLEELINIDTIKRIAKKFPKLNIDWILSGKGSMLKEESLLPVATSPRNVIRYYNMDASAGNVEMFENENSVEYEDLIIPGFSDCQKALNVWGDSMYPILKSGEIVILKEWDESFIEYGKIFLIVTKNGNRMIKYLKPGSESGKIKCVSENTAHDPFEIQIGDIHKLFLVKGHIERCAI